MSTSAGVALLTAGLLMFLASVIFGFVLQHRDTLQSNGGAETTALDPKDKDYADRLSAEIAADETERARLRRDNEDLDTRINTISQKLLQMTGKMADTPVDSGSDNQELKTALARCQGWVVSIISNNNAIGTGILYEADSVNTLVITCLPKDFRDEQISVGCHRDPLSHSKSDIVICPVRKVYGDSDTGLFIFAAVFGDAINRLRPLKSANFGSALPGDRVYSVLSQRNKDGAIDLAAFDGNLSTADRKLGAFKLLQVAIGTEEGLRGAPLINASGQLLGMMAATAREIERTSFAINSADLIIPLQFAKSSALVPPGVNPRSVRLSPQPVKRQTAKEAAKGQSPPYKMLESINLPSFVSGGPSSQSIFAGPDNLLIVWQFEMQRVAAYQPRHTQPAWEFKLKPGSFLGRIHNSDNVLICCHINHEAFELNLKTGQVAKSGMKCGDRMPAKVYRIGGGYLFADRAQSLTDSYLDPVTGIDTVNVGNDVVIGMIGNRIYSQDSRNFYHFDPAEILPMLKHAHECERKMDSIPHNEAAAREQAWKDTLESRQQVIASKKSVKNETGNGFINWQLFQIGNTDKYIYHRDQWEISPNGAHIIRTLNEPKHSASDEEWFRAYSEEAVSGTNILPPGIIDLSSDGKHALSATHVIDPGTLEVVSELPIPIRTGGFLSDGETIFAFDEGRGCIFFLSASALKGPNKGALAALQDKHQQVLDDVTAERQRADELRLRERRLNKDLEFAMLRVSSSRGSANSLERAEKGVVIVKTDLGSGSGFIVDEHGLVNFDGCCLQQDQREVASPEGYF